LPVGFVKADASVRLWEPGYRERYYRNKFGVELSDRKFVDQYVLVLYHAMAVLGLADTVRITKSYMEGLCWVLEYYYQGVPAWDWYYPYHYAPFAQDFRDVDKMKIEFQPAVPFKPFAQLLGVFPAARCVDGPPQSSGRSIAVAQTLNGCF
jgi:5'-3' exoribonuclease 2